MPPERDSDCFPVVIIGAGLAGLTAAAHLAARDLTPLVLETDRFWPGGRLAGGDPDTFDYQGRTWSFDSEHSVHALWGGYVNMRATLRRFLDLELQPSLGEEWINRWGRQVRTIEAGRIVRHGWIPAPFHYLTLLFHPAFWTTITPLDFLSLPGFLFSIFWTLGLDPIRERIALDGLPMSEYFRGWTPNLRATFTGLGINLLAAPEEDISLTGMIAAIRFYTMLRRDTWWPCYLPDNAHRCLIAPLIARIRSDGGEVMQGVEVEGLERTGEGWRLIVHDSARGGRRSLLARRVILAVSPPAAQRLLGASSSTRDQAAALRFPGAVRNATVRLWFSAQPRPGAPAGMLTGNFLPDNFFWLDRLFDEFAAWRQQTGGSVIELHLYANDSVLEQPDNVLLIRCVDEVQRAFPELRGHFVHGAIRLNSRVHTAFRVPTAESLHVETPWPDVFACGDWIGHPSPGLWMERSCTTAIVAVNQILLAHELEPYPVEITPPPESVARALGWLVRAFRLTIGRAVLAVARAFRR